MATAYSIIAAIKKLFDSLCSCPRSDLSSSIWSLSVWSLRPALKSSAVTVLPASFRLISKPGSVSSIILINWSTTWSWSYPSPISTVNFLFIKFRLALSISFLALTFSSIIPAQLAQFRPPIVTSTLVITNTFHS